MHLAEHDLNYFRPRIFLAIFVVSALWSSAASSTTAYDAVETPPKQLPPRLNIIEERHVRCRLSNGGPWLFEIDIPKQDVDMHLAIIHFPDAQTQTASFTREGISERFDWGPKGFLGPTPFAVVLTGTKGIYYDFTNVPNGNLAKTAGNSGLPSRIFEGFLTED